SGVSEDILWNNVHWLRPADQVKFVLSGRGDYEWAARILKQYPHLTDHEILFSPVFGMMDPRRLAEWILEDGLSARLQLQIHKYIWHPETRGV
ncbi:MAG TPA: 7-carboxy-7-deazaguanine synthase, partial [Nitrospiria bacterium]|nr:7-carboxy-7-deazaguanine synthase [Nitrospiria bacterium]